MQSLQQTIALSDSAQRAAVVLSTLILSNRLSHTFDYHWAVDRQRTYTITMNDGQNDEPAYDVTDLFTPAVVDELAYAGLVLIRNGSVRSGSRVAVLPGLHRVVSARFSATSLLAAKAAAVTVAVDGVELYMLANDHQKLMAALESRLLSALVRRTTPDDDVQQAKNAITALNTAAATEECPRRAAALELLTIVARNVDCYTINHLLAVLTRLPQQPEQVPTSINMSERMG